MTCGVHFVISIVRFNIKRKNVVWAPAFSGPIGFSLVSLMDNMALGVIKMPSLLVVVAEHCSCCSRIGLYFKCLRLTRLLQDYGKFV